MKATITQIYAGHVDEAIKANDLDRIRYIISKKQKAMVEAIELAKLYKDVKPAFADEEATRARRLQKEITQLEKSLK